jgi:hypothetical protein
MRRKKFDPKDLKTPLSYSGQIGKTKQYVSELLRKGKIAFVEIDGIRFVDVPRVKLVNGKPKAGNYGEPKIKVKKK